VIQIVVNQKEYFIHVTNHTIHHAKKTDYCDCYSCKHSYNKCCCEKKEDKCCIEVDYCGFLLIGNPNNTFPAGLYLNKSDMKLYQSVGDSTYPEEVLPKKSTTKFLDCNTKDLYKLYSDGNSITKCEKIKTIGKCDCVEFLFTDVMIKP
jgi:hypothetical protein